MKCHTRWALVTAAASAAAVFAACGDSKAKVELNWIGDPREAIGFAISQKRPLLIAFTGSDWSPASQNMQREVIETPQFKKFADENLVLYQADFPRYKTLAPDMARFNADLAKQCRVDGLPTYLLVSALPTGQLTPMGGVSGTTPGEQFLNQLWKRIGVQVTGAVVNPGWQAVTVGGQTTLATAINLAGGVSPDASSYAFITWQQPDGSTANKKVDIRPVLADAKNDVPLQIGQTVRILTDEENTAKK